MVKPGDVIEIQFGNRNTKVEVLRTDETCKKEEARELIANGFDPLEVRKAQKEKKTLREYNTNSNVYKDYLALVEEIK